MPTPASTLVAYADAADLIARYRPSTICELASDTDTPVSIESLDTNPRVQAVLLDASGDVEAAVGVGNAYRVADLAALTGAGLAFLKRIVCDLALGYLYLGTPDRGAELPQAFERAQETLKQMCEGMLVFGLQESKESGQTNLHVESASEVEARNGIVVTCDRFFSRRNNRLHG